MNEPNNPQKLMLKNHEDDHNKNSEDKTKNEEDNNNNNQVTTNTPVKQEIPEINQNEEEEIDYEEEEKKQQSAKRNLMFDEKSISPFKLYCHISETTEIILMIFGIIGSAGSAVAAPLLSYLFGDTFQKFTGVTEQKLAMLLQVNPVMVQQLMDEFKHDIDDMVKKMLYIGTGMFFAFFLNKFMWNYSGLRQMHHLKEKYFALILKQEQGWFDENNAYEFATKVQAQLEQISMGVGEKFGLCLTLVFMLICGLIIAFYKSWLLTLVMLAVSPFIFLCVLYLVKSLRKVIIGGRKTFEKAGGVAEEVLYNIKTVASFSNFDFEMQRFNELIDKVHDYNKEKALKMGISIGGVLFFVFMTFFVAIMYSRILIGDQKENDNTGKPFTPGDVMIVVLCTLIAVMSLGSVAPNIKIIQESAIASSDYFTLYERVPKIDLSNSNLKPDRDSIKGKIEFKNVDFIYPSDPNRRKILNNLNLTIEAGKKVALVGESGCGKSTTVNLIERLYECESGDVEIDGINIKNYDIEYLRNFIGYVQQEPVLFNTSIKQNLIFGRDEVVKSLGDPDELIKKACSEAYAKEFIEKNDDKYDYVVGIKGSKLSGGQKQRIAIARAILCEPKILILDEATSALDNQSEKEVQAALDHISEKNVTTVIIAHRLSTIKNADCIFAIKEGRVCEIGTHQELLEKNGYYAGLVKSQLAADELETNNAKKKKEKKKKLGELKKMISGQYSSRVSQQIFEPEKAYDKEDEPEKPREISHLRPFQLLKNDKCNVIIGSLASLIEGGLMPTTGWILSKAIIALSADVATERDTIMDDGLKWALWFLAIAFGNGLMVFFKLWKLETLGSVITNSLRKQIIEKYLQLHIGYYDIDENSPGALLTKLSLDTTQLNSIILTLVGDILSTTGNTIVGLVLGFYYDWKLTLIALCFIPFIVFSLVTAKNSIVGAIKGGKGNKIQIEAGSILSECVINTKTIFSFNFQQPAVDMYLNVLSGEISGYVWSSIRVGLFLGLGFFLLYACNATVTHYACKFIIDRKLTFSDMSSCITVVMMMTAGITNGLNGISDYSKARDAFISIYDVLDIESEINPFEKENKNKIQPDNIKGKIEFKNVSFSYPTKPDIKILKNISFVIETGTAAALVGYSGCGKSTIIQLIERYYDITEGEILIDGVNIKDYDIFHLRKKIGLVSQEPVLFKRSVYENILYGRLDATKEEVYNAAVNAKIDKFFTKKEMGTKEDPVSGGEKQRLAIARAFLKNPVILLLDEATSALDKESEVAVQKSIDELLKGRTSIAVAHRLSTIENSDVIFVLESGRIVEKGNHKELMALEGKYATLYKYSE